jgi:hypothetical protein
MKYEKRCSQLSTQFKKVRRQVNHLSVQTKLDSFAKPESLPSKTSTTSDPSIDE